jgi:cytochrome c
MIVRALLAGAAIIALSACGKSDDAATENETVAATTEISAPADSVAVSGETVFARCIACHSVDQGGKNGLGPNLHGVSRRSVASMAGFAYSAALKSKGGNWDEASLDAFLTSPVKYAPGTRMSFAGLSKPEERKAVIEYLASLK